MRISDWSSDVCSSDLLNHAVDTAYAALQKAKQVAPEVFQEAVGAANDMYDNVVSWAGDVAASVNDFTSDLGTRALNGLKSLTPGLYSWLNEDTGNVEGLNETGRASCRERVCQYV